MAYNPNPYEQPEAPRCPTCDEQMIEITSNIFPPYWECDNQECPDNIPGPIGDNLTKENE